MRTYQMSMLEQSETFSPIAIQKDHEMVVISKALNWDLFQEIAATARARVIKTTRGQTPHYRQLNGAVVVRILKGYDLRGTEDLIRNYIPARFLCDLQNSDWTPDHNTIWEYEVMLGELGLQEINDTVLREVTRLGFADPKGLCADTTAQEGFIPHPTEVGHMNSFMKSMKSNLETLLTNSKGIGRSLMNKLKEKFAKVGEKVRFHRLFAKTTEMRREINQELLSLSSDLANGLGSLIENIDLKANQVCGSGRRALNNLTEIYNNFCRMLPEIQEWIQSGKVAKEKIVSLFTPEFKAIDRGKIGKKIEFGLKWGINQVRGGYISIYMNNNMMAYDADYAVTAIEEHQRIFGISPRDFGFDRAAWSTEHKIQIRQQGVRNVAIAPKGTADWEVGPRVKDRMIRERAQVEGKIGTMKLNYGFNKSQAKKVFGVRRSAQRAALCFNLKRFAKDLALATNLKSASAMC
jgi:hypothetical protein